MLCSPVRAPASLVRFSFPEQLANYDCKQDIGLKFSLAIKSGGCFTADLYWESLGDWANEAVRRQRHFNQQRAPNKRTEPNRTEPRRAYQ